jgi:hypothetical protein
MKTFTTIMAAALIAGSAGFAMAQSGGGGAGAGGAGSDVNPDRLGKGADQNPTGAAGPQGGTKEAVTPGQARAGTTGTMKTAPVSGVPQGTTQSKDSTTPSQAPTGTSK